MKTRRILSVVISLVLILCMFSTFLGASAAHPNPGRGVSSFCRNNDAPSYAEARYLQLLVSNANREISTLVRIAKLTPWDDVDVLLDRIDAIVGRVFAYADRIGATVICEYEYHVIDGRTVAIDPLRVINF